MRSLRPFLANESAKDEDCAGLIYRFVDCYHKSETILKPCAMQRKQAEPLTPASATPCAYVAGT